MRWFVMPALAAMALPVTAHAATVKYDGVQSTIRYDSTATTASNNRGFTKATSSVLYDTVTDTYTVRDTGSLAITSNFGPGDIDSGASDATFTVYDKSSGSTVETFRLLNQGAGNPLIQLSYVTYGQWRRSTTTSGVTSTNDTYVVFGEKTPRSGVPIAGTANYTTVIDGTFTNKNGAYAVSGTGSFLADFGAGTISYSSTATGARESDSAVINFGTMTGSGSIAFRSATFAGTGSFNPQGYAMDVSGGFYGPAADEIGGVFRIRDSSTNRGNGTGAIVGN